MPETLRFDPLFPEHLTGRIGPIEVLDEDGTPNYVLELDRPWSMTIHWRMSSDAPAMHPADVLGGTWNVRQIVESMGVGPEQTIGSADVDFGPPPGATAALCEWNHTFDFPVGTINVEGVYKLITLITYRNAAGHRRAMAGFQEGPLVTFYRD